MSQTDTTVVDLASHPLSGLSLIEASAGTGKTYTITHLYLRYLLESGLDVRRILIVTFTNAATEELKGRIRELVSDVYAYISGAAAAETKKLDAYFDQWIGNDTAKDRLQAALINFDEASVYSIHGFCQRLLNTFPLETVSLFQPTIISNEFDLYQQAVRDFWRRDILPLPRHKLEWFLSQWKTPLDLGKAIRPLLGFEQKVRQTNQQTEAWLDQANPEQLWQQLSQLWSQHADQICQTVQANPALNKRTYNSKSVAALLESLDPLFKNPACYALPDKWLLLTRDKLKSSFNKGQDSSAADHPFFDLAQQYSEYLANLVTQQRKWWLTRAALAVGAQVEAAKAQAQEMSFDDLISQTREALDRGGEGLIAAVNTAFPVAMVDEFQDTDALQYSIFRLLYHRRPDTALVMIGDPKQSIYGFRRADVFTYRKAREISAQRFTLEINYRSSQDYVSMINRLFSHHQTAFVLPELIRYQAVRANAAEPKRLQQQGQTAAPLVCWVCPSQAQAISKQEAQRFFARRCAEEIARLLREQSLQLDDKAVTSSDLAVLVKTGYQATAVKHELAQLGIASALISRESVFATRQARDVLQLLSTLNTPEDSSLMLGLLATDLFGWSIEQIASLRQDANQLVQVIETIKSYRQAWQEKGILAMFFHLLEDQATVARVLAQVEGQRQLTNWLHLIDLLQQESIQHASHTQTQQWLNLQMESGAASADQHEHQLRLESDEGLVRIVTVHRSKGLQYPVVFLPFMWDVRAQSKSPGCYSYHDDSGSRQVMIDDDSQLARWREEELAEEVRLFYVAMTRAKYRTYLAWGDIKGSGNSAFAHLLYQDYLNKDKYPFELVLSSQQQLLAPIAELNSDELLVEIAVGSVDPDELIESESPAPVSLQTAEPLKIRRSIQQQWRVSSYSQIAARSEKLATLDRPDHDDLGTADEYPIGNEEYNRFSFIKGAKAGNFLHEVLELSDFENAADSIVLREKMEQYGINSAWQGCLTAWLNDILQSDLGGFRLADITKNKTLRELEFVLRCHQVKAKPIDQLLHQHGYLLDQQSLSFETLQGYLKGFIDLVIEHEDRFYVMDYKSNFLGHGYAAYGDEQMKMSMHEHLYHLQYLIYTLALNRYLRMRLPGYDYAKHFGGVVYLYLRGMSPNHPGKGVYLDRPDIKLVDRLDELFA